MHTLSAQSFAAVTQMFHRVSGIRLGEHKRALVSGRLHKLAQEAGEANLDAYVDKLVRGQVSPAEMTRVVDRLTTNETYFFREPEHYNHLAERLQAQPKGQEFLVWSAASSSGEEAYGAAMVMDDLLGASPWQVIGTDLSTAMVESAQRGLYTLERARMVPPAYLKRYCLKGHGAHEGELLIERGLREKVRFQPANLMTELPALPSFDIIFLRNVLIYFDNPAKEQIIRNVLTRLKPEGFLYTGHAESLSALKLPLRQVTTAVYTHG